VGISYIQRPGRFARRAPPDRLPSASALRLSSEKHRQPPRTLRWRHRRSKTTPGRPQFRQVAAHGAVQTVAPRHLCCLRRRTKGIQIRALSETRLRPRLRKSTSVLGISRSRREAPNVSTTVDTKQVVIYSLQYALNSADSSIPRMVRRSARSSGESSNRGSYPPLAGRQSRTAQAACRRCVGAQDRLRARIQGLLHAPQRHLHRAAGRRG
jgi:hypothetical protein